MHHPWFSHAIADQHRRYLADGAEQRRRGRPRTAPEPPPVVRVPAARRGALQRRPRPATAPRAVPPARLGRPA